MNNIEVSVCCLAFNHAKYIRKALDSLISQKTTFRYEILIHDDCSTDETKKIIMEYFLKYPELIKPIYEKDNKFSTGVCITDFIYPKAKGKYIALCEGDDYWCDDYKLQKQYNALEKNKNCRSCVHITSTCNEDGSFNAQVKPSRKYQLNEEKIFNQDQFAELLFKKASTKCPFQTSSYFFEKSIIERFESKNWSEERRSCYDANMLKMFLLAGDIYYINEIMSTYRIASTSSITVFTNVNNKRYIEMENLIIEDLNFDIYSNKNYHSYIMIEVYKYLLYCKEKKVNYNDNKRLMKKYNLNTYGYFKYLGIKRIVLHILYSCKLLKI